MTYWQVGPFVQDQCENRGLTVDTMISLLDGLRMREYAHDTTRHSIDVNGARITITGNTVVCVKKTPSELDMDAPNLLPRISKHAKARMSECGLEIADVLEALSCPRLLGGKHQGVQATVVVGTTHKKGPTILTLWRT